MSAAIRLANADLAVEIAPLGAELIRVADAEGREYLWNGDPQWWRGRAPLLFPMVGRALGDRIKVDGRYYPMPQHGFARRSTFEIAEKTATRAHFRLTDSEATRAAYPFAFQLDVAYELIGATLRTMATVLNTGEAPLPCAFGYHPALRWPLPGAGGPHEVVFEKPEPAPIRKPVNEMLSRETFANPFTSGRAIVKPEMFAGGALVFDRIESRSVSFRAVDGPAMRLDFPKLPHFALWTKPGAPYLCLEPWQGFSAPEGFDGEFSERPGVVAIAPGASRDFPLDIVIEGGN